MNGLTSKQQNIVSKYDITVRKDENSHDRLCYCFFVEGMYPQQKGFETELEAYLAGITYVLNKKK